MRTRMFLAGAMLIVAALPAAAAESHISIKSANNFSATLAKLQSAIEKRNFTKFAVIDHAAGAAKTGQSLRPTHLTIFGNATGGTVVMNCKQTVGLDLPLKALIWEDEAGAVQITVPVAAEMARRHATGACADDTIKAMDGVLRAIASEAAAP